MNRFKFWATAGALALISTVAHGAGPAERVPVLVELFTSEECSSCPPADAVLAQLVQQPVAGVEIIAMSEHIDGRDNGSNDPLSIVEFTLRQAAYNVSFHHVGERMPQMIIDGQTELRGNDRDQAIQQIARAGSRSKTPVTITRLESGIDNVKLQIQMTALPPGDIYLAVTENNLDSNVSRFENAGHKLSDIAVVRKLMLIGRTSESAPLVTQFVVRLEPKWRAAELRAVVFAQAMKNRSIMAVASAPLG